MNEAISKKPWPRRALRIAGITLLSLLLFLLLLILLIQTPPVQNFIRKKTVAYLENKLNSKVSLNKLYISLSGEIVLTQLYAEDRNKDTLISAGELAVSFRPWSLIRGNLAFSGISLRNAHVHIYRNHPDSAFNFQFIITAFSPSGPDKRKPDTATTASPISLGALKLDSIHWQFADTLSGIIFNGQLGQLQVNNFQFDGAHNFLKWQSSRLSGLQASLEQAKLPAPAQPDSSSTGSSPLIIEPGKTALQQVAFNYSDQGSGLQSQYRINQASLQTTQIDLGRQQVNIRSISLSNSSVLLNMYPVQGQPAARAVSDTGAHSPGWTITAESVELQNNHFQYNDEGKPRVKQGMDYAHLTVADINLDARDLAFRNGEISGNISSASLKSVPGFELRKLQTGFYYGSHKASLTDLLLQTGNSNIQMTADMSYPSLDALARDAGLLQFNVALNNSRLQMADLLYFVPSLREQPLFANGSDNLYASGKMSGSLSNLQLEHLRVRHSSIAAANIDGHISGLPELRQLQTNLNLHELYITAEELARWLPPNSLPPGLHGPLQLSGKINGRYSMMHADIALKGQQGKITLTGQAGNWLDSLAARYNLHLRTDQLNLAALLADSSLPASLAAAIQVQGQGYAPATMQSEFSGQLENLEYRGYTYAPLMLSGNIGNGQLQTDINLNDPNASFQFTGNLPVVHPERGLQLRLLVDSIKTAPLHLARADLAYHGLLTANFSNANPDALEGSAIISESQLVWEGRRVQADSVVFEAKHSDTGNMITLNSNFARLIIAGRYQLSAMGSIMAHALRPYFRTAASDTLKTNPEYDFMASAKIYDSKIWKALAPGLTAFDSASFSAGFHGADNWQTQFSLPRLDINGFQVRDLTASTRIEEQSLASRFDIGNFASGGNTLLYHSTINATVKDNHIETELTARDGADKTRYHFLARIWQPESGHYSIFIHPEKLLLNYDTWTMQPANELQIAPEGIRANQFALSRNQQMLRIQSQGEGYQAPLLVDLQQFRLGTITGFVKSDSTLADGLINGHLEVRDLSSNLHFNGRLTIDDLSIYGDTVGNARLNVERNNAEMYSANLVISGNGNDVEMDGTYRLAPNADAVADLKIDIGRLPLKTIEDFSFGALRASSGAVNGQLTLKGPVSKPDLNGDLHFNNAGFAIRMLNSYFKINGQTLQVNSNGLRFNQFTIKDSSNNSLVLDGTASTSDYRLYTFDMKARARNFQALNSSRQDNQLFYGKLFFNCDLNVKGNSDAPVADGRITVNENTDMTITLPQEEPGVVEREGIVQFVDMDATAKDSLFTNAFDTLNSVSLKGMDISANIEVDKAAQFKLVIDQGNGDYIQAKGEAKMSGGIDPSGKVSLTGSYEIEEGVYDLSFNFLHRKFKIDKGSKIIWAGEPTDATVEITATYTADAAPLDLVKNQLDPNLTAADRNKYLQKLPFQVNLIMEGKLMEPKISFDILLPEDQNYAVSNDIINNVESRLAILRQESGEMNKQVFSLLLLNRFMGDNPFNSSGSGPTAGTLARQSASKLLTEQLNRVAENLIEGVDLNFDIESSEDYTTGQRTDRTDLNVGVSKKLLNDRLTVTVGSNFQLEGPKNTGEQPSNIAGNIALHYRLSKDGRYMLRAYRKNEYEGEIDGYLIETGVGFVITLDYNRFRQLFMSKAAREKKRELRKAAKDKEKESQPAETDKKAIGQ